MDRQVIWTSWDGLVLEHLQVAREGLGWFADGIVCGVVDGRPLRCHYTVTCDRDWRTRQVSVEVAGQAPLRLRADGAGNWTSALAEPLLDLDGCRDVDLGLTPFTNTLPIRRLELSAGAAEDVPVVHVVVPDLTPVRVIRRYGCLTAGDFPTTGGRYRYERPDHGDATGDAIGNAIELAVDSDGLVLDCPDLYRRVYPSREHPQVDMARPVPERIPGIETRDGAGG